MRTIEATARVGPDHTLTVQVPPDVPPGEHRVVLVIENGLAVSAGPGETVHLPAHDSGLAPEVSLRREDLYADDGR